MQRAVDIACGGLATTNAITVRSVAGNIYQRIVDYELGPMPEPIAAGDLTDRYAADEIPF